MLLGPYLLLSSTEADVCCLSLLHTHHHPIQGEEAGEVVDEKQAVLQATRDLYRRR